MMSINFHQEENKTSYLNREAHITWKQELTPSLTAYKPSHVVDLGCGGGIYTRALATMGVPSVTGVDFSKVMIEAAQRHSASYPTVGYQIGTAKSTGLENHSADMVLARALLHHLDTLEPVFNEVSRIVAQDGLFLIQTRTTDDCFLKGTENHVRGFFFDCFPALMEVEKKRRYSVEAICAAYEKSGWTLERKWTFWETRARHSSKEVLLNDIRLRKGRSILHELSDSQLQKLTAHMQANIASRGAIEEKDRWTLLVAKKKDTPLS